MQNVNQFIKARREALGWTDLQMANRAGLTDMEYYDVEAHENELATVTPLMNVRRLAEAIDVSVHELFGLEPPPASMTWVPRDKLTAEARARLGVSVSEMGDAIGFEEVFVHALEGFGDFLEIVPFWIIETVANYLKIPPQDLL